LGSSGSTYLERCGSRLHKLFNYGGVTGNARVLVWPNYKTGLNGVFLPSLRRFTIPSPLPPTASFLLSSRTIYATDAQTNDFGLLWTAPAPFLPQSHKR
jgi:hypothetical protein